MNRNIVATFAALSMIFSAGCATKNYVSKETLDELATEVPNTAHYILEVSGNTDSVGGADYNYSLSQRRAFAVIQYMAQAHNIPAHKFYIVGLGKDKPAASNGSASGRQENRRVDVRLMTNTTESPAAAQNNAPATPSA